GRAGGRETFTRAEAGARQVGLTVTRSDPSAGLLEAMATSRLFGFHDDIAIRVRPEADGTSRIDMRSKSRDGQGDFGVNAARIRTFVKRSRPLGRPLVEQPRGSEDSEANIRSSPRSRAGGEAHDTLSDDWPDAGTSRPQWR